jgi:hypothetical protein
MCGRRIRCARLIIFVHNFSIVSNTEEKQQTERILVQGRSQMGWWTAVRLALVSGMASGWILVSGQAANEALAAAPPARHKPPHSNCAPYAKPEPPYAKWGKRAVQYAHVCYPNAAVVDYLHIGRRRIGENQAEEVFRLWLREGKREWGILVRVQFQVSPERFLSIRCEKAP